MNPDNHPPIDFGLKFRGRHRSKRSQFNRKPQQVTPPIPPNYNPQIHKAKQYVSQPYPKPFTAEDVAKSKVRQAIEWIRQECRELVDDFKGIQEKPVKFAAAIAVVLVIIFVFPYFQNHIEVRSEQQSS